MLEDDFLEHCLDKIPLLHVKLPYSQLETLLDQDHIRNTLGRLSPVRTAQYLEAILMNLERKNHHELIEILNILIPLCHLYKNRATEWSTILLSMGTNHRHHTLRILRMHFLDSGGPLSTVRHESYLDISPYLTCLHLLISSSNHHHPSIQSLLETELLGLLLHEENALPSPIDGSLWKSCLFREMRSNVSMVSILSHLIIQSSSNRYQTSLPLATFVINRLVHWLNGYPEMDAHQLCSSLYAWFDQSSIPILKEGGTSEALEKLCCLYRFLRSLLPSSVQASAFKTWLSAHLHFIDIFTYRIRMLHILQSYLHHDKDIALLTIQRCLLNNNIVHTDVMTYLDKVVFRQYELLLSVETTSYPKKHPYYYKQLLIPAEEIEIHSLVKDYQKILHLPTHLYHFMKTRPIWFTLVFLPHLASLSEATELYQELTTINQVTLSLSPPVIINCHLNLSFMAWKRLHTLLSPLEFPTINQNPSLYHHHSQLPLSSILDSVLSVYTECCYPHSLLTTEHKINLLAQVHASFRSYMRVLNSLPMVCWHSNLLRIFQVLSSCMHLPDSWLLNLAIRTLLVPLFSISSFHSIVIDILLRALFSHKASITHAYMIGQWAAHIPPSCFHKLKEPLLQIRSHYEKTTLSWLITQIDQFFLGYHLVISFLPPPSLLLLPSNLTS
jgi:hypothetical protein